MAPQDVGPLAAYAVVALAGAAVALAGALRGRAGRGARLRAGGAAVALCGLALIALTLARAARHRPAAPPEESGPPGDWARHVTRDGAVGADMPGAVRADGPRLMSEHPDAGFLLSAGDPPAELAGAGPDAVFGWVRGQIDVGLGEAPRELLAERALVLGGCPAREWEFRKHEPTRAVVVRYRVLIVGGRVYRAIGQTAERYAADGRRFLDSVRPERPNP